MAQTPHDFVYNAMIENRVAGVLCVDDNPLVGEALGITLRQERGMKWLGQRLTADNLRKAIEDLQPDVILLDLDMPGRDPFDALLEVSDEFPDIRVIVLTGHVRREYVDRAFECGAWGYLSKSEGASRIVSAIRRVLVDEIVMSPEVEAVIGQ